MGGAKLSDRFLEKSSFDKVSVKLPDLNLHQIIGYKLFYKMKNKICHKIFFLVINGFY